MKTCGVCGKETPVSYAVTVKGYEDVDLCSECQGFIEAVAHEAEVRLDSKTKERLEAIISVGNDMADDHEKLDTEFSRGAALGYRMMARQIERALAGQING